jgi:hypothetical protein
MLLQPVGWEAVLQQALSPSGRSRQGRWSQGGGGVNVAVLAIHLQFEKLLAWSRSDHERI